MATLTIRNVPDTLLRRLRERAGAHRRSLDHEVLTCLEQATQSAILDPEAILARARAVRRRPRGLRVTDRLAGLRTPGARDRRRDEPAGMR